MIAITDDGLAQNPGPKISGVAVIAKTVKCMRSSYEGELEAIKIAILYARDSISP